MKFGFAVWFMLCKPHWSKQRKPKLRKVLFLYILHILPSTSSHVFPLSTLCLFPEIFSLRGASSSSTLTSTFFSIAQQPHLSPSIPPPHLSPQHWKATSLLLRLEALSWTFLKIPPHPTPTPSSASVLSCLFFHPPCGMSQQSTRPIMLLSNWSLPPSLQSTHLMTSKSAVSLILKPRPDQLNPDNTQQPPTTEDRVQIWVHRDVRTSTR